MNPASKDIAQYLAGESSLGLVLGTSLFYARMPDSPDDCVTVMDNPGDAPMLTYDKATSNYYYSSVSVRVRNTDYAAGWAVIFAILTFLHGLGQQNSVDASSYYGVVKAMNDPQVLYWDNNDRVTFFINFEIQRKPN